MHNMQPARSDCTLCTEALLNFLRDTVVTNDSCQVIQNHGYVRVASGVQDRDCRDWVTDVWGDTWETQNQLDTMRLGQYYTTRVNQTSRFLLRKQTSPGCFSHWEPGGDTIKGFGDSVINGTNNTVVRSLRSVRAVLYCKYGI